MISLVQQTPQKGANSVSQTFPQSLNKLFGVYTHKAQGRQLPIMESFSCSPTGTTTTYAYIVCMQEQPHTHKGTILY